MQENNFEKQVRETLDALHLAPSAPVWQRVEASLKKKKERRLVFWLLPFLLIATGVVLWQAPIRPSGTITAQQTAKAAPKAPPTFSEPHITTQQQTAEDKTKAPSKYGTGKKSNRIAPITVIPEQKNLVALTTPRKQTLPNAKKQMTATRSTEKNSRHTRVTDVIADHNKQGHSPVTEAPATIGTTATETATADTLQQAPSLKKDSLTNQALPVVKKKASKKQWEWRVVSRIGASNLVASLATGIGAKSLEQADLQPTYSGGLTTSVGIPFADRMAARQPSTPVKGWQFTAGIAAKRPVAKNSFVVVGLQYGFYSSYQDVGSEVPPDTLVRGNTSMDATRKMFRNNGAQNRFINQLHVLELPIGFEYRVFKKLPLHVQHGVSISQVLASRVLQYDMATNTYSQSPAALCKTGVNLFTSVDYTVWKTKAFSLQAGPYLQYGLNSIYKSGAARHVLAGGVAVHMDF